jgi:hypothetical protein
MSSVINISDVRFSDDTLSVYLENGEVIATPLEWYPRLFHASTKQRNNWKMIGAGYGIHWPEVDEDMIAGQPSMGYRKKNVSSGKPSSDTSSLEMR